MILCFIDREHRLAAGRRPSTKDNCYAVSINELLRLFSERRPIGGPIFRGGDNSEAFAVNVDATGLVDLFDRHLLSFLEGRFGDGHGPTEGVKNTDFDVSIKIGS